MDPHLHEQASLCLALEGSYREKIHALEHAHGPRHLLYYPAYVVHSQTLEYKGAKKIIFPPRERWAEAHGMEIPWASRPGMADSLPAAHSFTLSARFWKVPE
jgi:hypothetical protein